MKKDKDGSEQHTVKKNSRDSLVEKFGPVANLNLHLDSRERLVEIAQWLDRFHYEELKQTKGHVFHKTISNLINMVYIDNIYEPKTKAAKTLKKLYERYFELNKDPSITLIKLKNTLSKEYAKPKDIRKGKTAVNGKGWSNDDLEQLQDYRWIIQTMENLDGISREETQSGVKKK
ncbi:hypothetical protein EEP06_03510 [Salmonella enterica]|uniref:hypothetical protein n=1 Tax=Leminorella grimontii TaxID=82981 RepID=UPI000FA6D93D|nr:hypothetical protein [Salmonella enterica]